MTADALDPQRLLQKISPSLAKKFYDPASFFGNVNPMVLASLGVLAFGGMIAAGAFIVKKAVTSENSKVKYVVNYLKELLIYNAIIVSF